MANKYTHSKSPTSQKAKTRPNGNARLSLKKLGLNRFKGANLTVGGKRQLGDNFGEYIHPLGKTYDKTTGVIGKINRAVSVS